MRTWNKALILCSHVPCGNFFGFIIYKLIYLGPNHLLSQMFHLHKNTMHNCPYQLGNKCSKETILNIWRNIFQFCLFISCLVTIKAKSNAKLFSMMMSIEFWPNCNQTAHK